MTAPSIETRVLALELLWVALADKYCRLSNLSTVEMGKVLSEEFDEARLDSGAGVNPETRAAMRYAAQVARRLTTQPDV